MGKVYAATKNNFSENAKKIMTYQVNNGGLNDSFHELDQYINFDSFAEEELADMDEEMEAAINQYAAEYRQKHEEEYPEQRMFYNVKGRMEQDALFSLFKKMPKGGLLHVHSTAGLSFEHLMLLCEQWNFLQEMQKKEDYVIRVNTRQSTSRLAQYTLMYTYQEERLKEAGIVPISQKLGDFLKQEGNFEKLKDALCIIREIRNSKEVWREFNRKYSRFNMLFKNAVFYYNYHKEFFDECVADNIDFVQLRCGFEQFENANENGEAQAHEEHILRSSPTFSIDDYLYHKDAALKVGENGIPTAENTKFLKEINKASIMSFSDTGGGVKVILTVNRGKNPEKDREELENKLDLAIGIRHTKDRELQAIASMIIGFDFVNQEDKCFATSAYADIIYGDTKCMGQSGSRIGLIPFYLHDGETNWKNGPGIQWGDSEKIPNVIGGSICSRYRIGHSFSSVNYPELLNAIRYGLVGGTEEVVDQISLPVLEINPISNQVLKYTPDLRQHPVYHLLKQGINCVLGNDDPLILDNPGLSYDIWMLVMDAEVDYSMLKKMIYVSFIFSELSASAEELNDDVLARAGKRFKEKWGDFLKRQKNEKLYVEKFIGL